MSHTPRPWHWVRHSPSGLLDIYAGDTASGRSVYVATVTLTDNARLIAAAPDLLDMLERIVRATLDGAIHPSDPVIRDARALIEKMRG